VIEPENSEALVQAIARMESDRALGVTLGQKGRDYIVQNFSRAQTAEKYVQILDAIVRMGHS
jgi:glycosyltransferase involved in cell wall biosynthesis